MFYPIAAFGLFVAMKKSFILHIDSLAILEEMTFEQKGILFDAIYKHQLGEEVTLDFSMKMAFAPFKNQFIRDNEKYSEFIDKQKDNGSKGGRPKKPTEPNETQKTQAFSENPTEPKKAYNDSVSDNVSVSESNFNFKKSFIELGVEENILNEWLVVRKNKKAVNTKTAFEAIKKEIEISKIHPNEVIKKLVVNSWSGFKFSWLSNNFNNNTNSNTDEQPRLPTADKAAIAAKYGKPNATS